MMSNVRYGRGSVWRQECPCAHLQQANHLKAASNAGSVIMRLYHADLQSSVVKQLNCTTTTKQTLLIMCFRFGT